MRVLARATSAAVAVLAIVQVALYVVVAIRTIGYPYPLEWMEGGTVDVMSRVLNGLPLFTRPTALYVPYIYPPLYYWISAQVARFAGVGFAAPRLVSLASVAATLILIARFIRRSGGDWIDALAGLALYLGTYEATERWFHVARVDSLFVALALGGFYALQFGSTWKSAAAAGVVWFLACLTKQTTLLVVLPALAVAAIGAPSRPLLAGAVFLALTAVAALAMHVTSTGWSTFFLYRLPMLHGAAIHGSYWFWRYDIARNVPLAALLVAVATGLAGARRAIAWRWTAALCVGGVVASWSARLHSGGSANSLMPAFAALAIAMPLAVKTISTREKWLVAGRAAIALQLALMLHGWTGRVPSASDLAAGQRFEAFLRAQSGEIIVWHQRFVETRAGKRSWGLEMAAEDVLRASDRQIASDLRADIASACRDPRVAGVVDPPDWLRGDVAFGAPIELFADPAVFRPIAGAPKRPERFFPVDHQLSAVRRDRSN